MEETTDEETGVTLCKKEEKPYTSQDSFGQ